MRTLREIAHDIAHDWKRPYFGAVPYLRAMTQLQKVTDTYYYDTGKSIVLYFLSNASTWRGETARKIKSELKGMVK